MAYIRGCNLKIFCLCQSTKCRAATNGAKPAKFIPQKTKRNNRPAPFMRPGIVKSPRKAKRNREFRQSANFPYLCGVFLPPYRLFGIQTAAPGSPGAVFYFLLCGFQPNEARARNSWMITFVSILSQSRGWAFFAIF